MATRILARRLLAVLREAERQVDVVAEILVPGPLGPAGAKWLSRDAQAAASQAVNDAKRRWVEAQRAGAFTGCPRSDIHGS
jgi:hypothetical protein